MLKGCFPLSFPSNMHNIKYSTILEAPLLILINDNVGTGQVKNLDNLILSFIVSFHAIFRSHSFPRETNKDPPHFTLFQLYMSFRNLG
jgi:hypothetical protein